MRETYTLDEIKEKLEHEKYLRKENQELYEELQILKKCSVGTNDLANEYKKRIDKAIEYIEDNYMTYKEASAYRDGIDNDYKIQISSIADLIDILKGSDPNE